MSLDDDNHDYEIGPAAQDRSHEPVGAAAAQDRSHEARRHAAGAMLVIALIIFA